MADTDNRVNRLLEIERNDLNKYRKSNKMKQKGGVK